MSTYKSHKSKNKSQIQSGAWVCSSLIHFVAVLILGSLSLVYGYIAILIFIFILFGYYLLTKATIGIITGRVTSQNTISTVAAIHVVSLLPSIYVIAVMSSFHRIVM